MKLFPVIALFVIGCSNTDGPQEIVIRSIYSHYGISSVSSVEVLRYDSLYSSHFILDKTITSTDSISQLPDLLEKLPEEGEIMISFVGSEPYYNILLKESGTKTDTIEIIANMVKTPAASFYDPPRSSEMKFVERVLAQ